MTGPSLTASGRVPKTVSTFSIARILATGTQPASLSVGMRPTEKIALVLVLLVPLLVATVGWPMFVNWIAGPEPQPTPQVAGAAATSVAAARAVQPTARPTEGGPPTLDPAATRQAAAAGPTARPATPT